MKIIRAAAFTASIAFLAIGVTGCSSISNSEGPDSFVNYDKINAEYKESLKKLELPPGSKPPADLVEEDKSAVFQVGWGDTQASNYYECAWQKEWLEAHGKDAKREKVALEHLEKIPEMPFVKDKQRADDSVRNYVNDYLEKARLGDPSAIQEQAPFYC